VRRLFLHIDDLNYRVAPTRLAGQSLCARSRHLQRNLLGQTPANHWLLRLSGHQMKHLVGVACFSRRLVSRFLQCWQCRQVETLCGWRCGSPPAGLSIGSSQILTASQR
jgi:hypothetical protein